MKFEVRSSKFEVRSSKFEVRMKNAENPPALLGYSFELRTSNFELQQFRPRPLTRRFAPPSPEGEGSGDHGLEITISATFTGRSIASTTIAAISFGSIKSERRSLQNVVSIPPGATEMIRAFVPFASARSASV